MTCSALLLPSFRPSDHPTGWTLGVNRLDPLLGRLLFGPRNPGGDPEQGVQSLGDPAVSFRDRS